MNDRLMHTEEVAERLGVSINTLAMWRWKRIHLPYSRMGRRIIYRESDVDALIEQGRVEPQWTYTRTATADTRTTIPRT